MWQFEDSQATYGASTDPFNNRSDGWGDGDAGYGFSDGNGYGSGYNWSDGNGCGYGNGWDNGNGQGDGDGDLHGDGWGRGRGKGW